MKGAGKNMPQGMPCLFTPENHRVKESPHASAEESISDRRNPRHW